MSTKWDFLLTACDIAGIETPENVDGISLPPEFLGNTQQQEKHEYLYWEWRNMKAIRVGRWKLYCINSISPDEPLIYELYDLETDISEQINVAHKNPQLIEKFTPYFREATIEK